MEPGNKIILETERLLFRPHILADLDAWCVMEMDPLVRRYTGGRPRTRQQAEQTFFERGMTPVHDRLGMWATVFKPENQYIGRCGVYPHFAENGKPIPGEGSMGYYLASSYWGRGVATEAASAFVKFGFEELGLNRIVTEVEVGNDASVHILEKLGFILERTETGPRSFYHFTLQNPGSD
jgi:[ribosomal protein S5]-alanine N-acetyltransferase